MDSNATIAAIAHKHGLNEKDTETLGDLVLTHLRVFSADGLLEIEEDKVLRDKFDENQMKLDELMRTTARPILNAFEEFLRIQLEEIEKASKAQPE